MFDRFPEGQKSRRQAVLCKRTCFVYELLTDNRNRLTSYDMTLFAARFEQIY